MKQCYLAFEIGAMQKTVFPLQGPTTIGRSADNTITLPDPTTSRNHAKIIFTEGSWVVQDLGSANGIIYNGQKVDRVVLKFGDVFRIGGITFRYIEKDDFGQRDQLYETVQILVSTSDDADFKLSMKTREKDIEQGKPWSEKLQDAVAAIPFFSPLNAGDRKELVDAATLHVFNSGEMIIREGDPGRSIYVILEGRVRVFTRDHLDEELELAVLEAGHFVGEMSFLTGKPRSSSVAALDTSIVVELTHTSMRKVVKEHPTVKEALVKYYRYRWRNTAQKRAEARKEKPQGEGRSKNRLHVQIKILSQTTPNGAVKAGPWSGISLNINESAVVVRIQEAPADAFKAQAEVQLEIELPEPWGRILTLGKIHRVKSAQTDEEITLVGIDYSGIADSEAKKLKEYLSS